MKIDLSTIQTIVTHDSCADGLASALILRAAIPRAEVLFVQHGTRDLAELRATPGLLFCDITPPAARVREFVDAGAVVLDHHATARDVVAAFGEHGVFADEKTEPGVSGALLAYREVWAANRVAAPSLEDFARLAGIRDTWQRSDPRWGEACAQQAALLFWPRATWLAAPSYDWESLAAIGPTLIAKRDESVAWAIKRAAQFEVGGRRGVIFEGLSLTSDAAEALHGDVDLVVGFGFDVEDGREKVIYSLRSHTDFDCAAFAKARGGGGHRQAAGFSVALWEHDVQPYEFFRRTLATERR